MLHLNTGSDPEAGHSVRGRQPRNSRRRQARAVKRSSRRHIINVYLILLRQSERSAKRTNSASLKPDIIASLAESKGVQVLDFITCMGTVEAAFLCRASDNSNIARLLDSLDGWYTEALLATSHVRY